MSDLSLPAILAARAESRPEDLAIGRAVLRAEPPPDMSDPVTEHVIANLGMTRTWVAELTPAEWAHVADFLLGLVSREPVKSSARYVAERLLLGTLARELDSYARCAGELPRAERDVDAPRLRATGTGLPDDRA